MKLFPAIDLLDGKVVRLAQGNYGASTEYGDDAVAVATSFVDAGAEWVHIVDLNAARADGPVNRPLIAAVAKELDGIAAIQTGGGVRSIDDVQELSDAGVARVVMGSAAIRDPDLVARCAPVLPIAVGLDHRDGRGIERALCAAELADRGLDLRDRRDAPVDVAHRVQGRAEGGVRHRRGHVEEVALVAHVVLVILVQALRCSLVHVAHDEQVLGVVA